MTLFDLHFTGLPCASRIRNTLGSLSRRKPIEACEVRPGQSEATRIPGNEVLHGPSKSVVGSECPGIDKLYKLAKAAATQEHGCLLVISPKAAEESTRLKTQSTLVEPFLLDDAVTELVTAIDGAVLVDTTGKCHAIRVILDGVAAEGCTPERGARYNSAVKYHALHRDTIILVKSEDGMVNIFPDLLPQMKRSEL